MGDDEELAVIYLPALTFTLGDLSQHKPYVLCSLEFGPLLTTLWWVYRAYIVELKLYAILYANCFIKRISTVFSHVNVFSQFYNWGKKLIIF